MGTRPGGLRWAWDQTLVAELGQLVTEAPPHPQILPRTSQLVLVNLKAVARGDGHKCMQDRGACLEGIGSKYCQGF